MERTLVCDPFSFCRLFSDRCAGSPDRLRARSYSRLGRNPIARIHQRPGTTLAAHRLSLRNSAPDHLHGRRNLACGRRTSQTFFLPGCTDDDDVFCRARNPGYVPHILEGTPRFSARTDGNCDDHLQSGSYRRRRLLRAFLRSLRAAAEHYHCAALCDMPHPPLGLFPDNRAADDGCVHDAVYGSGGMGRDSGAHNRAFTG